MSTTGRTTSLVVTLGAVAALAAGCGGTTVEGTPETTPVSEPVGTVSSAPVGGEERPREVGSEVSPPPAPPEASPTPAPVGAPPPAAPAPAPGAPAPAPPPGAPVQPGDFPALLGQAGLAVPPGKDPVALATESCGRLDGGQTMVDVTRWLGGETGYTPEQQGYFLGMAVGTYCPQNVGRLG